MGNLYPPNYLGLFEFHNSSTTFFFSGYNFFEQATCLSVPCSCSLSLPNRDSSLKPTVGRRHFGQEKYTAILAKTLAWKSNLLRQYSLFGTETMLPLYKPLQLYNISPLKNPLYRQLLKKQQNKPFMFNSTRTEMYIKSP